MSRRTALERLGVVGAGAAGLALVGCGDGGDTADTAPDRGMEDEAANVAEPVESVEAGGAPAEADDGREAPQPDMPTLEMSDADPADDPEATAGMPAEETPARGWREVAVAGVRPAARSNAVLALDEAGGTLWLHGGRAGGQALSDLWAFDLASGAWREVTAAGGPEARFAHVGVLDGRGRLVVFAGQGAGASRFFSDAWAYDTRGGGWSLLADAGAGPVSRYGLGVGHDPAGGAMWISHGFTHQGRFDDTWVLELESGVWRDVSPRGERPVRRCLHACAYEPGTGALALFGGQTNGVAQLGDTWLLSDGGWREVEGAGPSARRFPTLVAVAARSGCSVGWGRMAPVGNSGAWTETATVGGRRRRRAGRGRGTHMRRPPETTGCCTCSAGTVPEAS